MESAPTIRTLALAAGVSKTTVSLALRDHPRIRPEVRQRIQRLAEELGYRPNALMANLLTQLRASKTTGYQSTLGLLCIARDQSMLQTVPTFRSWIAGCRARATEQGYGFDHLWAHEPGISPARLVQILDARNIRGLAVIGFYEGEAVVRAFDPIWQRSASVALGTRPTWPPLHFVSNDQYVTVAQAVRELARLGYQRPGLCVGRHVDDIIENKFSASFWATQQRLGIEPCVPVFDVQPGAEAGFSRWLKTYRPDVILTIHAEIKGWLHSLGLDAPTDIGLITLDKSSEFDGWAGMQQNNDFIGRSVIDMVIGQLHRNESGVPLFQKCMLINSTWVPGATVRGKEEPGATSPARRQSPSTNSTISRRRSRAPVPD